MSAGHRWWQLRCGGSSTLCNGGSASRGAWYLEEGLNILLAIFRL